MTTPQDKNCFWPGITISLGGEEIGRTKPRKSTTDPPDDAPAATDQSSLELVDFVEEPTVKGVSDECDPHLLLAAQLDMWGFFKDHRNRRTIPAECVFSVIDFMYGIGFTIGSTVEPTVAYTDFHFTYVHSGEKDERTTNH